MSEAIEVLVIGDSRNSKVIEAAKEAFADTLVVYYRAHSAHWNVTGPAFGPYHDFFGLIAADLYAALDPLAEQILMMGGIAPSDLPAALECATIAPATTQSNDPRTLCLDLLEMNEMLTATLNRGFACADEYNEQGLADVLAGRIDASKKWSWQLTKSVSQ